jgi:crotonobetaine/carnitine-CoA ligase
VARAQGPIEQMMRKRVADHPEATWLKFRDEEYSWQEVLSNVQRAANGLLELGVRPAEKVALLLPNRPEFLWTHLGIIFIGAHSVPVNTSQRGQTLTHILSDSDAVTAILHEDLRDAFLAVKNACPKLRTTVVLDGKPGDGIDWDFDRLMDAPDAEPEIELEEPSGGVGMMYTSGTTGPPKGVVATKYDLSPLTTILGASGVQAGETMYTPLPMFHGNALLISMLGSIFLDAKFALAERFSASRFWDDCGRYEAVEFNSLGGMMSILLKQPPSPRDRDHQVRVVLSAAAPPDRWREFEERFGVKIIEFYGMVDSPGFLLNTEGRVGSMGKPIADIDFAVLDDDDQPLPPGQIGEVAFRHPMGQLTHYHNLPDATADAYRGGWFHSGDLAVVDDEGWWYYKGRKKESMRRLGENISAWEIETVVNQHPEILESGAHAVKSELGEDEVKVVVVPQPGAGPSPESILDFCAGKMAHYAIPRYVEIVEALPKTETHRIQYAALKARGITPDTWDREAAGYKVQKR